MHWLFDRASLTARLVGLCGAGFRVDVIRQSSRRPRLDEARVLGMRLGRKALIREVLLCCEHDVWVFARTVIPLSTLTGPQRVYARLGSRPLGAMLFSDKTMRRGPVQVSTMMPAQLPVALAEEEIIWGRRSVFRVGGKPLLVSEYFLPQLLGRTRGQ